MNIKSTAFLLLNFSILTLVACSTDKKTESSVQSTDSQVSQKQEQESANKQEAKEHIKEKTSSAKPTDTDLAYNGRYYSIHGKYEEILIVNKRYPLSPQYNPGENAIAKAALLKLIEDMQTAGYAISSQYSGFRSYDTQADLYQNYVNRDGKEAADRYSARPGYSEHQSGLAFDLIDTKGNLLEETDASQWLLHHAHRYGFIVRYLEGKENSTGYMPESWHLRYIGQEAKEIAESGKSLEEYFGISGGSYQE